MFILKNWLPSKKKKHQPVVTKYHLSTESTSDGTSRPPTFCAGCEWFSLRLALLHTHYCLLVLKKILAALLLFLWCICTALRITLKSPSAVISVQSPTFTCTAPSSSLLDVWAKCHECKNYKYFVFLFCLNSKRQNNKHKKKKKMKKIPRVSENFCPTTLQTYRCVHASIGLYLRESGDGWLA